MYYKFISCSFLPVDYDLLLGALSVDFIRIQFQILCSGNLPPTHKLYSIVPWSFSWIIALWITIQDLLMHNRRENYRGRKQFI